MAPSRGSKVCEARNVPLSLFQALASMAMLEAFHAAMRESQINMAAELGVEAPSLSEAPNASAMPLAAMPPTPAP